jgi:hypothetical protein
MATEAGVGLDTILPALGKGIATPDVALALRFADAVLDNAPELMEVTEEVRQRFGEKTRAGWRRRSSPGSSIRSSNAGSATLMPARRW